jgi:hypothetical protein
MKKLLTIVLVALVLCLGISAALAADALKFPSVAAFEAWMALGDSTSDYELVKGTSEHGEYLPVVVTSQADETVPGDKPATQIVYVKEHTVTVDATKSTTGDCKTIGTVVYKCSACDWTKTVNASYGPHKYEYTVVKAATCEKAGEYVYKCSVCGAKTLDVDGDGKNDSDGIIPKLSADGKHAYVIGKYTTKTAPHCNDSKAIVNGQKYPVCDRCGYVNIYGAVAFSGDTPEEWIEDYRAVEAANGNVIAADFDGHDWGNWTDGEITCGIGTNKVRWCKVCSKIETQELDATKRLKANYVGSAIAPNALNCKLTADKVKFVCSFCKGTIHKTLTGADLTVTNITSNIKDSDGKLITDPKVADKTVTKVGTRFSVKNEDGKEFELVVYHTLQYVGRAFTPATDKVCVYPTIGNFKCSVCGEANIYAVEAAPVAHKWSDWKVKAEGDSETTKVWARSCSVCGKPEDKTSATKPVDKCEEGKHNYVKQPIEKWVCGEETTQKSICSICGDVKTETVKMDHEFELIATAKAATCKEAGSAIYACKYCKLSETRAIEKTAHTWDEGKITKEATKDAKGVKTFTCTVCGATKTEDVEYVVTADPKYSVSALAYNGQTVTGKVAHTPDTKEAEGLTIRVTFFLAGNYYMATIGDIEADGTFSVDGVGPIEYISVVINGTSSVNPNDVVSLGSGQLEVK